MNKLQLTIEIPVNEEEMQDLVVEDKELLDSIRIVDHNVLDGVEIVREDIGELFNHSYFSLNGRSGEITDISLIIEEV